MNGQVEVQQVLSKYGAMTFKRLQSYFETSEQSLRRKLQTLTKSGLVQKRKLKYYNALHRRTMIQTLYEVQDNE